MPLWQGTTCHASLPYHPILLYRCSNSRVERLHNIPQHEHDRYARPLVPRRFCFFALAQMCALWFTGAFVPFAMLQAAAVLAPGLLGAAVRAAPLPGALSPRALPSHLPPAGGQELRVRPHAAPHALLAAPQARRPRPQRRHTAPSTPAPASGGRPNADRRPPCKHGDSACGSMAWRQMCPCAS